MGRERFLPSAAGVLHGGINAATIAAQGLTGTSASDLMRLAVPVRDPDNGDTISGSGSKLKCPFCERTYGYETNLRAHIRQRHQESGCGLVLPDPAVISGQYTCT